MSGARIRVRGLGASLSGASVVRVVVDGQAFPSDGKPVEVEPGAHLVRVQGTAWRSRNLSVTVLAGETAELELVMTGAAKAAALVFGAVFAATVAAARWAPERLDEFLERGPAAGVVAAAVIASGLASCVGEIRALRRAAPGSPERFFDRREIRLALAAALVAGGFLGGPKLLLRGRDPRFDFNHGEVRGRFACRRLCVEDHSAAGVPTTCWTHPQGSPAELRIEKWRTEAMPPVGADWTRAGSMDVSGFPAAVYARPNGARYPRRELLVELDRPYVSFRFESALGWKEGTPPADFKDVEPGEHERLLARFFSNLRLR